MSTDSDYEFDEEWEDIGGERIYFEEDAEIDYFDLNEEAKEMYDIEDYG